jgi:hypothetical protein
MHPAFGSTAAPAAAGWTWPAEDQLALVAARIRQVVCEASHERARHGMTSAVAATALPVRVVPTATGGPA